MGNINHSTEFPANFLSSVANVIRKKLKTYLEEHMKQTGFKPPVKVIADKDN